STTSHSGTVRRISAISASVIRGASARHATHFSFANVAAIVYPPIAMRDWGLGKHRPGRSSTPQHPNLQHPTPNPYYRLASPLTRPRSSGPNQGGAPAAAFSVIRPDREVAGIAAVTRVSLAIHFRSACAHVVTPKARSGSSSAGSGERC